MNTHDDAHGAAASPAAPPPSGLRAFASYTGYGVKLLVLSLCLLEGLYLILGNLFLAFGLKRVVSWDPETFTMDYEAAWSYWPGHAKVRKFKITGQDSVLQWSMDIEKATLGVELLELFEQRYHATHVEAEGTVFRMRFRVSDETANSPYARALPPIAGFADPPLAFVGPVLVPTDQDYNLWTAHLENIDAGIDEIWIETFRLTGDLRAKSAFYFKPLRTFSLPPSQVEIVFGELQTADHQVLHGMEGSLFASIEPFNVETGGLPEMLHAMTSHVTLNAQVPGMRFVQDVLGLDTPQFRDGSGALEVDTGIERGVLTQGSRARYATRRLDVDTIDAGLTAAVETTLRVDGGRSTISAFLDEASLHWAKPAGVPVAMVDDARVTVEMPADVLAPWKVEVYDVELPSARVSDLRRLLPEAPKTMRLTGGSALLRGHLAGRAGQQGQGSLQLDVWKASAGIASVALQASIGAKVDVTAIDLASQSAVLRGTVGMGKVFVQQGEDSFRDWWARVRFDGVRMHVGRSVDVRGDARVTMQSLDPLVGSLVGLDAIPGWSEPLISSKQVAIDMNVNKQGTRLAVGFDAVAGSQQVTGMLERRREHTRGAFLVRSGPVSAGIHLDSDGASVKLLAGRGWLKEQLAALREWAVREAQVPERDGKAAPAAGKVGRVVKETEQAGEKAARLVKKAEAKVHEKPKARRPPAER
ncbi:hypothetical protein [Chondromyces apiculatus]|uniref:DUF3971 domain-containing protein n=1 Tax=Chondromyces apiculatus DSM 436 TaxID=1192034 RepID=A0A017TGB5_9BACT|nr:hypothetical protein [Chondromyces apiculatus]EYF07865.1 Hypothetical protein CAP_6887 [Chondromyces apiculatus DSM 436]